MEEKKLTDDADINVGMTDEEIIKALKECEKHGWAFHRYLEGDTVRTEHISVLALDLIRRLQYGYSSASKASDEWRAKYETVLKDYYAEKQTCDEQKEEIERYQCVNKLLEGDIEALNKALEKRVEDVYADFMQDYKIMCDELNGLYEENSRLDGCAKQSLADYQKCEIENAELRKQVDELKELPCKVGDTVYWVWEEFTNGKQKLSIQEWQVDTIQLKKDEWAVRGVGKERQDGSREFFWCHSSKFGIWWFLTPEEAKKRLKEVQE